MRSGAAVSPAFLEGFFLWGYSSIFFLAMKAQRRAVAANLRALMGGPRWLNRLRSLRVVHHFAWTCLDSVRARMDADCLEWRLDGADWFAKLAAEPGGALLITAHMGSYDVAASCFCGKFPRPLHLVRTPEREENLRRLREEELRPSSGLPLHVHYNHPEAHLGLVLAQALAQGEFVAVQGDRVLLDVSGNDADLEGVRFHLPRGPFVLAVMGNSTAYPLFVVREGWRRFAIRACEPVLPADLPGRGEQRAAQLQHAWLRRFAPVLRRYWSQWFVFEPLLSEVPGSERPSRPEVAAPVARDAPREGTTSRDPHPAWMGILFAFLVWIGLSREMLPVMPCGWLGIVAWSVWIACLPPLSFVLVHFPIIAAGNVGGWLRKRKIVSARGRDHLQELSAVSWMTVWLAWREAPPAWPWFRHLPWIWLAALVVRAGQWAWFYAAGKSRPARTKGL